MHWRSTAADADPRVESAPAHPASGALVPAPSGWPLRVLGAYYVLFGGLSVISCLAVVATGHSTRRVDEESGLWLPLAGWLPYVLWFSISGAALALGVALIRRRSWSRWVGMIVACTFLADGLISFHRRAADVPSVLIAYVLPIASIAVLVSQWKQLAVPAHPRCRSPASTGERRSGR